MNLCSKRSRPPGVALLAASAALVSSLSLACERAPVPPASDRLTHAPMLGAVTETTASLWLRTSTPCEVTVSVRPADVTGGEALVREVATLASADHSAVVRFDDLQPDTAHVYRVDDGGAGAEGTFTTQGPASRARAVRLVVGSCYKPEDDRPGDESIFFAMAERKADAVVFLGDFPYSDIGERDDLLAQHRRIRALPGFAALTGSTPTYAIWDDHDFGPNNTDGTHPHADEALEAFRLAWANPGYGLPDAPGIFSSFRIGGAEVFLTDGRYPARQAEGTMLGAAQFDWLVDGLARSTARYKVIVSGSAFGAHSEDAWAGEPFAAERQRLLDAIAEHDVRGVLVVSGDLHRSELWRHPIGNGRDLYELVSSPLAREAKNEKKLGEHRLESIARDNMFGEIELRPAGAEGAPVVLRIFSLAHGLEAELELSATDLGLDAASAVPGQ